MNLNELSEKIQTKRVKTNNTQSRKSVSTLVSTTPARTKSCKRRDQLKRKKALQRCSTSLPIPNADFFEIQSENKCSKHAINNCYGEQLLTDKFLQEIASQMDKEYESKKIKRKHPSATENGDYDIQLIARCCSQKGHKIYKVYFICCKIYNCMMIGNIFFNKIEFLTLLNIFISF